MTKIFNIFKTLSIIALISCSSITDDDNADVTETGVLDSSTSDTSDTSGTLDTSDKSDDQFFDIMHSSDQPIGGTETGEDCISVQECHMTTCDATTQCSLATCEIRCYSQMCDSTECLELAVDNLIWCLSASEISEESCEACLGKFHASVLICNQG